MSAPAAFSVALANETATAQLMADLALLIGPGDVITLTGDLGAGKTAAAGGFTEVAVLPNTHPAVQTKNEIVYLSQGNNNRLVQIHPMANITKNSKGEELTEMAMLVETLH